MAPLMVLEAPFSPCRARTPSHQPQTPHAQIKRDFTTHTKKLKTHPSNSHNPPDCPRPPRPLIDLRLIPSYQNSPRQDKYLSAPPPAHGTPPRLASRSGPPRPTSNPAARTHPHPPPPTPTHPHPPRPPPPHHGQIPPPAIVGSIARSADNSSNPPTTSHRPAARNQQPGPNRPRASCSRTQHPRPASPQRAPPSHRAPPPPPPPPATPCPPAPAPHPHGTLRWRPAVAQPVATAAAARTRPPAAPGAHAGRTGLHGRQGLCTAPLSWRAELSMITDGGRIVASYVVPLLQAASEEETRRILWRAEAEAPCIRFGSMCIWSEPAAAPRRPLTSRMPLLCPLLGPNSAPPPLLCRAPLAQHSRCSAGAAATAWGC